jgi:clan AA aspartic protease
MIIGTVNADFEPIISLSIRGSDGKVYTQDAVIDTGFNGWLSLPPDLIVQLNLKWKRRGRAILGDGSECVFNVYEATVIWDGMTMVIPVDEADSEPLVGMLMMEGYELIVQVFEHGIVQLRDVNARSTDKTPR